ncbi:MAG: hypothetical protein ACF8OB_05000 [Phycisphaeraceae bacterium JB051]
MSALKKSELVPDRLNQTEFATVDGNPHVAGTIGDGAQVRAEKHSKVNWRAVFSVMSLFALVACMFPSMAMAQSATAPTATEFEQIYGVIDPVTMSYAIGTLGGAALVAAFSVGGGFRIGKKAYSWIMSKI